MPATRTKAEVLSQKEKLVNSYNELLQYDYFIQYGVRILLTDYREFSSTDLRSVGNYTLGRLIGKGSFGKVYLATHKLTNNSKVCLTKQRRRIHLTEPLGRSEVLE